MRKQRKKAMAAVTAAVLIMSVLGLPGASPLFAVREAATAADVQTYQTQDGLTYVTEDGEAIITRFDDSIASLTIPSELGGLPVTTIRSQAFLFCNGLTDVYIPDSVTRIEQNAFDSCTGLTSVRLPSHITEIAPHTFETCTKLQSITIPEGVTTIGARAFYYCYALETIVFPDSLTTIADATYSESAFGFTPWLMQHPTGMVYAGKVAYRYVGNAPSGTQVELADGTVSISLGAFLSYSGITSVTIPSSVRYIDDYAFQKCRGLTSITIPDGVKRIGKYAFSYCANLETVSIGASVSKIGEAALISCPALTTVSLPESLEKIQASTFQSCTALKSLVIPAQVTQIGNRAFAYCSALTSLQIPASVSKIGTEVFANALSLTAIEVASDNPAYAGIDGVLYSKDQTHCIAYPVNRAGTRYVIPEGVTTIEPCAFFYAAGLTEVEFPESLTDIQKEAFAYCMNITSIALSSGLATIGAFAFEDCAKVSSVTIPPSVRSIGTCAFGYAYDSAKNQDVAVSGFAMAGAAGSAAEDYAAQHDFAFTAIAVLAGDVNGDGQLSVADLVLFEHFLVRDNVRNANWQAADMDQNEALNALDLCLLKREMLASHKSTEEPDESPALFFREQKGTFA